MRIKKILKILAIIFIILVNTITCFVGYGYYMFNTSLITNNKPFKYVSHYINPETALLNERFKVYNENYILQFYNTPELPYLNGKNGFRDHKNYIKYFKKHVQMEIDEFGEDWFEVTSFLYRGIAYFKTENYEQALISFDKQLRIYSNMSADAKHYKAHSFKEQGNILIAKLLIKDAVVDYNFGYYNNKPYLETLRQSYPNDLEAFKIGLQ